MGKNPVVAVVAVIIIVVAVILMLRSGSGAGTGGAGATAVPWYDTGTSKLYGQTELSAIPPVKAPSGEEGVRAFVFSCTNCSDKSSQFIAYLEKYAPEARAEYEKLRSSEDMPARAAAQQNTMVRGEDDTEWVERMTDEGQAIIFSAADQCAPSPAQPCTTYVP